MEFSPKREQVLGAVKENVEIDNDDSLEQNDSLATLCITRWQLEQMLLIKQ